jgi:hypothetical protein
MRRGRPRQTAERIAPIVSTPIIAKEIKTAARAAETVGKVHAANRAAADKFTANVLPIVRTIQASGISSLAGIADALNVRGIRTARGSVWHASTLRNLLTRTPA